MYFGTKLVQKCQKIQLFTLRINENTGRNHTFFKNFRYYFSLLGAQFVNIIKNIYYYYSFQLSYNITTKLQLIKNGKMQKVHEILHS